MLTISHTSPHLNFTESLGWKYRNVPMVQRENKGTEYEVTNKPKSDNQLLEEILKVLQHEILCTTA
jgi:hypothetical protein